MGSLGSLLGIAAVLVVILLITGNISPDSVASGVRSISSWIQGTGMWLVGLAQSMARGWGYSI